MSVLAQMKMKPWIDEIDRLVQAGEYDAAKMICQRRLVENPDEDDALYLLGTVSLMAGAYSAGLLPLGRLVEINPEHLNALINLGNCYLALRRLSEAYECFQKVLSQDQKNVSALNNLGAICMDRKKYQEALGFFEKAAKRVPGDVEVCSNLMLSYAALKLKAKAIPLALQIVRTAHAGRALFPAFNLLNQCCFWKETAAILPTLLRNIAEGKIASRDFEHINLSLLSCAELTHESLFGVLQKSGMSVEALRSAPPFQDRPLSPVQRLRIGYLSPDFRRHVVDHFVRGLIRHHDREQFEVFCYSNTGVEDEVTARYRTQADHFIDIREMNDLQAAEKIKADGIHFLIDLAGFTEGGRLPVLSYRPAPVQLMYLGYPYTSGLETVDYFISDPYLDGPENAKYFTEKQIRLPASFVSFTPPERGGISKEIPLAHNQWVTFGALVNPCKLNPEVVSVWSEILRRLPESKLRLNHPEYDAEVTRSNILKVFKACGIDFGRISFAWHAHPSGNFLQYYNEIDIVLDTFPATGGTTTIDALQMGKPVVTLVGKVSHERLSYSILKNVGLDLQDLLAFSKREYIEKTVALALRPEGIKALLDEVPEALKTSILCDPLRFTRQMESLYFDAWHKKYDFIPVSKNLRPMTEAVSP